MKRITIITMQLHTPGGIERFVSTLATMFSKDYEVKIIANYGKPNESLAFNLPKNVRISFLSPTKPEEISMKNLITNFKWHKIPSELIRRKNINAEKDRVFRNALSTLQTDFIITDRAAYNFLVKKHYHGSAKKIATDHNHHQNNPKYIKELLSSIEGFNYLIIATKELRDFYATKTKVKCRCIANPLPSIPNKKSDLKTKNIISVGRLVPEKDFPLLISAIGIVNKKIPDIHLTIIGDGSEKAHLKSQISEQQLSNHITLTGWLSQDKIAEYYYNSSLFAITSKTEAFGLVLTEAMSYGLPCLALKRASGARAQISKDIGILLNTEDPQDIANAIFAVFTEPDLLKAYQKNINQNIQKYSLDSVRSEWEAILNS
jgi:N-acetylglucosaminyldiphosphoundecaprenol N-acetyl-beta-D-mannosaminyltransferase